MAPDGIPQRKHCVDIDLRRVLPVKEQIRIVRRFELFFERRLKQAYRAALALDMATAEMAIVRVLGEVGQPRTLGWIAAKVELDEGYVCRTLGGLVLWEQARRLGEVSKDKREAEYELTPAGMHTFEAMQRFHEHRIGRVLDELPLRQQRRLTAAMARIMDVLTRDPIEDLLEVDDDRRRLRMATLPPGRGAASRSRRSS